ncbi:6-pyruvoyl trahydropterin synthase family protein [Parapedobacter koreensis]|uniref:6-carboxy-5,6,7,8-tetrahydropterin synthase n=1 Tax=Parapedobacter koreensis TaxID=332977 RepID=A0A1H7IET4_9SPHI|nr:6-carboxytetrahydropterin synthase [Parapedobacter koreensis]SEK60277.1 6-pyruvoyltetrahydropterin/6-carboxytetrahydropterin synthase [Parapedobacter koreensis]
MIYVTRRERFSAAHFMYNKALSREENMRLYGKCAGIHGHNYELFVTVSGEINPETGYLIDLGILGHIIREHVVDLLDHRNLNENVAFLEGLPTSTEVLAGEIFHQLEALVAAAGISLHKVKLVETKNNYTEYGGDTWQ